ncbi:MAG TPA: aldehyde ferredoxin oxidoreductase C-terminal domain-containing protein, partial [Syntrophorhabdaceae bacterium]|nr:aldehyde ferredoxin oxidoreductase C-terminal domain-containing protein [Syntrophorhabdaceae bacterium]
MLNPIYYILWSTGEKVNITQIEGQIPQMPMEKHIREEFVKDWIQIPTGKEERFKQFILEWGDEGKNFPFWPPPDLIAELVEWQETMHYIDDSFGLCAGVSSFPIKPPYHIHNLPLFMAYGTGIDMDEEKLWNAALRIRNLIRSYNITRGLKREDETPPQDHWKKRFPEYEQKLMDEYYKYRGWDLRGVPTKETLQKLNLDYVYEDFVKRGIHKEE